MDYLYHGSTTQNIQVLEPKKRYSPSGIDFDAIYATPLSAYAAAHSFPWSTAEGVILSVNDTSVMLTVPKEFKERLQVPISIYKISSDSFIHTKEEKTGYTRHTIHPVPVIEEVKYNTVEEALKETGAELHYK